MKRAAECISISLLEQATVPEIGFHYRPFVLCGIPLKRQPKSELVHLRHNGDTTLRIVGDPEYGLPWGQDRLILIWLVTEAVRRQSREITFASAADVLTTFGLVNNGTTYRRLVEGFRRVLNSKFEFRRLGSHQDMIVTAAQQYTVSSETLLWYDPDFKQLYLPGLVNIVRLSEGFWREIQAHPVPLDLAIVRALSNNPGALDLYTWLTWRCWRVRGAVSVPLFGQDGLMHQFGVSDYHRARKFRESMYHWLLRVVDAWPKCPARLSPDRNTLVLRAGTSVRPRISTTAC